MNEWYSDPVFIILVGLAFALGAGMIFERMQKYRSSRKLAQKGMITQGEIIRRWSIDVSSNHKPAWIKGWKNNYYVSYQFEVEALNSSVRLFTKNRV